MDNSVFLLLGFLMVVAVLVFVIYSNWNIYKDR